MKFLMSRLRYPDDCIRISQVALSRGWYITPPEAERLWDDVSESVSAGWLILPDDDEELWWQIRGYFEND